jgi:hypothetical protein
MMNTVPLVLMISIRRLKNKKSALNHVSPDKISREESPYLVVVLFA